MLCAHSRGLTEVAHHIEQHVSQRVDALGAMLITLSVLQHAFDHQNGQSVTQIGEQRGRTMTLTRPVSSSSVRNTKPLAVPGRWRDDRAGHAHPLSVTNRSTSARRTSRRVSASAATAERQAGALVVGECAGQVHTAAAG